MNRTPPHASRRRPAQRGSLAGAALVLTIGLAGPATRATADPGAPPDLGAGTTAPVAPAVPAEPVAEPAAARPTPSTAVTLVTGDQVRLDVDPNGQQTTRVLPAAGTAAGDGRGVTALSFDWHGDQYVIPVDAVPYVGSALDVRLFNVSYLARAGLGGAGGAVPVTVRETLGDAADLPGTRVTGETGSLATATLTGSPAFGQLLADQWRASRAGTSTAPAGRLPGFGQISLAAPKGTQAPPASPLGRTEAAGDALPYHTLTVDLTDLDDTPGSAVVVVQNVDDFRLSFVTATAAGSLRASVPEGTYSVAAAIVTPELTSTEADTALVIDPEIEVDGATTVSLDARDAAPYEATLDTATPIAQRWDYVTFTRSSATGGRFGIGGFALFSFRLVSATPPIPGATAYVHRLFAASVGESSTGQFDFEAAAEVHPADSAAPAYALHFPARGAVPASLTYDIDPSDLITVHRDVHVPAAAAGCVMNITTEWRIGHNSDFAVATAASPGPRVDYWYTSDPELTTWRSQLRNLCTGTFSTDYRPVESGADVHEVWGKGPFVPSTVAPGVEENVLFGPVGVPELDMCAACRQDDTATLFLLPAADSGRLHYGDRRYFSDSQVRFFRDGELAFSSAPYKVSGFMPNPLPLPMLAEPAEYRLEWRQANPLLHGSATTTAWTFRSGPDGAAAALPENVHCALDATRACSFLPLLFVNYDLDVDFSSRASAGAPFDVTFEVNHQQYQAPPSGLTATVSASYDDGATWTEPVGAGPRDGNRFTAAIEHPALADTNGFVSLRVIVRDDAGNAVEQTTIRAYQLVE